MARDLRNSCLLLIRGIDLPIALSSFPGLPMGLRRQQKAELRHVRLLFRCAAGGSLTTQIIPDETSAGFAQCVDRVSFRDQFSKLG